MVQIVVNQTLSIIPLPIYASFSSYEEFRLLPPLQLVSFSSSLLWEFLLHLAMMPGK
jgi:hypothetical protein